MLCDTPSDSGYLVEHRATSASGWYVGRRGCRYLLAGTDTLNGLWPPIPRTPDARRSPRIARRVTTTRSSTPSKRDLADRYRGKSLRAGRVSLVDGFATSPITRSGCATCTSPKRRGDLDQSRAAPAAQAPPAPAGNRQAGRQDPRGRLCADSAVDVLRRRPRQGRTRARPRQEGIRQAAIAGQAGRRTRDRALRRAAVQGNGAVVQRKRCQVLPGRPDLAARGPSLWSRSLLPGLGGVRVGSVWGIGGPREVVLAAPGDVALIPPDVVLAAPDVVLVSAGCRAGCAGCCAGSAPGGGVRTPRARRMTYIPLFGALDGTAGATLGTHLIGAGRMVSRSWWSRRGGR